MTAAPARASAPVPALPKAPVLDWSSFRRHVDGRVDPSVQDLPHFAYTTSGRAALQHALRQLAFPAGTGVLVPTYHCPTMVAPVLRAGLRPVYFGLDANGLPDLAALQRAGRPEARAIIVAHYFGLPRSLAEVRRWCDAYGVALIEDCAHAFFGQAGERPVGAWGDFATASLSKFFPVPEAGLLGSAHRPLAALGLRAPSLRAQLKGWVDVLEFAARHRRLAGLRPLLAAVFALKNRRQRSTAPALPTWQAGSPQADARMKDCDMVRVEHAPLAASMALNASLPRARILLRRRENYAAYQQAFADVAGARPLFADPPPAAAPYVFPLWVDDADRVYQAIRDAELPVFRWDRIWPGTPELPGDVGPAWSLHVLQLLCHQDLRPADVARTIDVVKGLLAPVSRPVAAAAPTKHLRSGPPHELAA